MNFNERWNIKQKYPFPLKDIFKKIQGKELYNEQKYTFLFYSVLVYQSQSVYEVYEVDV